MLYSIIAAFYYRILVIERLYMEGLTSASSMGQGMTARSKWHLEKGHQGCSRGCYPVAVAAYSVKCSSCLAKPQLKSLLRNAFPLLI